MNLEFVSTDDLVWELLSRFDVGLATFAKSNNGTLGHGEYERVRFFKGNNHMIVGICREEEVLAMGRLEIERDRPIEEGDVG